MNHQQSPSLSKVLGMNQPNVNSKQPHASEINHFGKKNIVGGPQQHIAKLGSGASLHQQESSQSFKTSPMKHEGALPKNYHQHMNLPSSNKAQSKFLLVTL